MKKTLTILTVISFAFLVACGSPQKKAEEPPKVASVDYGAWVNQSNKQLAKIPVEGFSYKSSDVPSQKWDRWAKMSAPVVKKIIDNLPQGYILQVTGHTDSRGPEEPEGDKPGNIKLSNDRAKEVHSALRRQGIKSDKMTYKGVGSSDPISGVAPRSAQQRRVTFKVIPE